MARMLVQLLALTCAAASTCFATTGDLSLSTGGHRSPAFSVRRWQRARDRGQTDSVQRDGELLRLQGIGDDTYLRPVRADFKAHNFTQRVSHFRDAPIPEGAPTTFAQRYWYDASFYKSGGPVVVLDGGETSGAGRLPFLDHGVVRILIQELGGIGIILEHRYYGASMPFANLSIDSLKYLTTAQHLADCAYFARNVKLPGLSDVDLDPAKVPWIIYGGSYAGASAAFARKVYPEVFWGGIASSAVTHAQVDYWQYYDTIRLHAPHECMANLQTFTTFIDATLNLQKETLTSNLKWAFGLRNVTDDRDFVNVLASPLGYWQARNWDPEVSTTGFDRFCDALTNTDPNETTVSSADVRLLELLSLIGTTTPDLLPVGFPLQAFISYAKYIRSTVEQDCDEDDQDLCFGTGGEGGEYARDDAHQTWRSWIWQVCTQWGYFQGGAPREHPTIVSRLIDVEYNSRVCKLAFGNAVPATPNVTAVNQYGDFGLTSSRLAYIDGSADPWLGATPHSPYSPSGGVRKDTTSQPFKLIDEGVHHWDENGLKNPIEEPEAIVHVHADEKRFVRSWVKDFRPARRSRSA